MTVSLNFDEMTATSMELGHIGEHNATTLEVTWTNSDERVSSYRVAFQTGGKSVLSDSFFSMPIEVALWQQLTLNPRMSIQIIAYDSEGDYIGKSEKFSGFYFAPSVQSNEAAADTDQHDIGAELSKVEATVADHEERIDALEVKTEIFEINGTKTGYEWFNLYKTAVLKYRGNEIFGAKYDSNTKIATFFFYEKSAFDEGIFYVSVDDLKRTAEDLNPQGDIHLHENKAVIDKFSFEDGKLLYDGQEIGGGGAVNDVQDANGNSLVADGIATIPNEVIEICDNGTLKYTPTQIQQLRLTKELKYNSFEFVYINMHTTSPITYAIYYLRPDNVPNRPLLYRDIWTDAGVLTETKKVAQFSDENFTTAEKNKLASLATVATTGDYDDLSDKPDLSVYALSSSLGAVATSNDYADLDNKPTIVSPVQPDWNEGDSTALDFIKNKPTIPVQGTITSGSTGYATGGDVYDAIQGGGGVPSGTNNGDILVWNGSAWVTAPAWRSMYQPVEYIESSGTQYIDTGVPITSDLRMVLERANVNTGDCIEGALYNSGSVSSFSWGTNGATSYNFGSLVGSNTSAWGASNVPADANKHTVDMSSGSQKLDGVEYATQTIAESSVTIGLFAWHAGGNFNTRYSTRVYSCKFYNGDTLIRDYIPVYNVFNGEIGLFDKQNYKFYGNQGTGTFTKGADVN